MQRHLAKLKFALLAGILVAGTWGMLSVEGGALLEYERTMNLVATWGLWAPLLFARQTALLP